MGTTVNSNIGVYKVIKFIKVPDRRLFSGLLYINVVNHALNDENNDFIQQMYETDDDGTAIPTSISDSNMFAASPTYYDRGRGGMKHSFADYDCFVFSVCGGMSLSGGVTSPGGTWTTYRGADATGNNNPLVVAGYANWGGQFNNIYYWRKSDGTNGNQFSGNDNTATWYEEGSGPNGTSDVGDPFGDTCCHFIKYHLLSRMNNGSGHAHNASGVEFYKHRPTLKKTWTQNTDGDINSSNPAVVNANDEWILSHGTYDTEEVDGTDLTKKELAVVSHGTSNSNYDGMDNDSSDSAEPKDEGNTYFAPVDKISIYGTHHLGTDSHEQSGNNPDKIWGQGANSVHIDNFWSFVVEIGLRGNNPGGGTNSASNKALIQSNVLVSFQPFGETAAFVVSDSKHTS